MISEDVCVWLNNGLLVSAGLCDYTGAPLATRCLAMKAKPNSYCKLYLNKSSNAMFSTFLTVDRKISVSVEQPSTARSLQLKGCIVDVLTPYESDFGYCENYKRQFALFTEPFGFTRTMCDLFSPPPDNSFVVIEIRIEQVFEQTPGKGL